MPKIEQQLKVKIKDWHEAPLEAYFFKNILIDKNHTFLDVLQTFPFVRKPRI